MSICFIGDIHGDFFVLDEIVKDAPEDMTFIQVGDFGIWPWTRGRWTGGRKVYFIDGNHDHIPSLPIDNGSPVEVWPNAFYVPRGLVLTMDGIQILFLGGSKSVDRAWRVQNSAQHGWFEEEQLTERQAKRALKNAKDGINLMVTHAPPNSVIRRNFAPEGLESFGHDPKKWVDESALLVERVWEKLGKPPLICGHMHRSVKDGPVEILDCNSTLIWKKP